MEDFLHVANNFIASSFLSVISFNYRLGDLVTRSLVYVLQAVYSVLEAIVEALIVLIQDLELFLTEIAEYGLSIKQSLSELGDHLEMPSSAIPGFMSHNATLWASITSAISDFFQGLGGNIIDSLRLIPQGFHLLLLTLQTIHGLCCTKEVLLGGVCFLLTLYYLSKTLRSLWKSVPPEVLQQFGAFLCLATYSLALQGGTTAIRLLRCSLRAAALTLHHIHLPSFHHAASDPLEDSDSKLRQVLDRMQDGGEDVRALLQQLERDDKLCVVCQDVEKCIVIMPCRHLCICQRCKDLLIQGPRACPICRKKIGHTIKAFM